MRAILFSAREKYVVDVTIAVTSLSAIRATVCHISTSISPRQVGEGLLPIDRRQRTIINVVSTDNHWSRQGHYANATTRQRFDTKNRLARVELVRLIRPAQFGR
jgi:hypothetical protein